MGASWVPVIIFTTIWAIVGGILPFIVPRGPQKGVQIVVLVLTASCCWLFWLCCYMSQMNPLIGPVLSQSSLFAIKKYWSGWEMPSEDSGHAIDLGGHDGIPSVGGLGGSD